MLQKICITIVLLGFTSNSFADTFLLPKDIGRGYRQVRNFLLREGNIPVNQQHNLHRQCLGSQDICLDYKEVSGCAVDQNTPCRFEWKSQLGRRFYIITSGSDPKNLIVMGMGYDRPGDD